MITLFTQKPPAVSEGGFSGASSIALDYQKPWTFNFLDRRLTRIAIHAFYGLDFFPQFSIGKTMDMATTGGGDTFDICGQGAFQLRYESFTLQETEPTAIFKLKVRRSYEPVKEAAESTEENPGPHPELFIGVFEVVDTVEENVNTLPGSYSMQTRATGPSNEVHYEYQGGEPPGDPPRFAKVGETNLIEPVTADSLGEAAREWTREMALQELPGTYVITSPGATYSISRSQTAEGWNVLTHAGICFLKNEDVAPEEPGDYEIDNIGVVYDGDLRGNKPVVYDEVHGNISGNAIYGNGAAYHQLHNLITSNKWKDELGTFDQNQDGLDDIAWVASYECAGYHREGFGSVSRGRLISADGGRYRVVLQKTGGVEVLSVEVPPGEEVEYSFPFVATDLLAITPTFLRVEQFVGGVWTSLDPDAVYAQVSPQLTVTTRVLHSLKKRVGERWGHPEFVVPDVPDTTYDVPVDEKRYRLRTLRKSARP